MVVCLHFSGSLGIANFIDDLSRANVSYHRVDEVSFYFSKVLVSKTIFHPLWRFPISFRFKFITGILLRKLGSEDAKALKGRLTTFHRVLAGKKGYDPKNAKKGREQLIATRAANLNSDKPPCTPKRRSAEVADLSSGGSQEAHARGSTSSSHWRAVSMMSSERRPASIRKRSQITVSPMATLVWPVAEQ